MNYYETAEPRRCLTCESLDHRECDPDALRVHEQWEVEEENEDS